MSHSGEKQSRECVILSVCFCSACFPTTICIWCRRLFVADDFLQNTFKNDSFLESSLSNIEHTMCHPHLIPSFLLSVMTCVLSQKAGLVGRRANFELNPDDFPQRHFKLRLRSVAMVSDAAHKKKTKTKKENTQRSCFCPGSWINRYKKRPPPHQSFCEEMKPPFHCGWHVLKYI